MLHIMRKGFAISIGRGSAPELSPIMTSSGDLMARHRFGMDVGKSNALHAKSGLMKSPSRRTGRHQMAVKLSVDRAYMLQDTFRSIIFHKVKLRKLCVCKITDVQSVVQTSAVDMLLIMIIRAVAEKNRAVSACEASYVMDATLDLGHSKIQYLHSKAQLNICASNTVREPR